MQIAARIAWAGAVVLAATLSACQSNIRVGADAGDWQETSHGVVVQLDDSALRQLRLDIIDENAMHVVVGPGERDSRSVDPMMVTAKPGNTEFDVAELDGTLRVTTASLSAEIELATGKVRYIDANGELLLAEDGRSLVPAGSDYPLQQHFLRQSGESLYGLGQRQDGRVDVAGENLELTTHNIIISIPFLTSSRGYGILWNNASITRVGGTEAPQPLADDFTLYDAEGNPGALTVRYFDGDTLLLETLAADLDYQFLAQGNERENPFPPETADADNLRIEWTGSIAPKASGEHEFRMYSSGYARLDIGDALTIDRWRMNWNPWYHNAKAKLSAGERYPFNLDWRTQGGYFRLVQHRPATPAESRRLSFAANAGDSVDYYVVAGHNADAVIAGYRRLTGKATMLPKRAFGYWQSRERYKSQEELLDVLEEYRERRIPIDNIVLDWSYWPVDAWGSHDFDPAYFPDPKAMVDRVHELDANIMISVWPKFYPTTAHYRELDARGCMFNKNIEEKNLDWIAPGFLNAFYDAFGADCRALYWEQMRDSLNVFGFDAWWLDAVEPDMHSNLSFEHRKDAMTPNAMGTGSELFNAYALPHAEAVHAGERATDPDKRSFILTRSGFGGIQRTGAAIWSGDIVTRWSNLKDQVAAGISVGLSGMPYWTFDIGGFTPEDHYRYFSGGAVGRFDQMPEEHRASWQEINLRWFQFGAFAPLFRSHGQNPYREIFNLADDGSEVYESLVRYTRLRYRLMPYIYTLAGDAYHHDSTMMRGLVMDFPDDPKVRGISTQYLFGPSLLVNPVYEANARSRSVYLPAGSVWYNLDTGAKYAGGRTIDATAPLATMPVFVRAGAIVPTGPDIQHTGESLNAPLLLNVYAGADGKFTLYEDDGVGYGYEKGAYSRIPISYDDASGTVSIGAREGRFDGMAEQREIAIRWIDGPGPAIDAGTPDVTVSYDGSARTVPRPQ